MTRGLAILGLFLATILAIQAKRSDSEGLWPDINNAQPRQERQTPYDSLSSAEVDRRREQLQEQLRLLNQRRRHRYDKDRRCCEKSLEAEDSVEDSPCCQRLQKQKCPYQEERRCGVPELRPLPQQYKTYTKKVQRIIEVTESPEAFAILERQRIEKLEEDLRKLRQGEEERLLRYEEKRRLELEEQLQKEEGHDEARLTELERSRRIELEQELADYRRSEVERVKLLSEQKRRELQAKLEAEKAKEEKDRRKREDDLWRKLEDELSFNDNQLGDLEKERRDRLERDLIEERQNQLNLRKKRHDDLRFQLESDLKEQRKRDLDQLERLEEERRREFQAELERLRLLQQKKQVVVEDHEVVHEPLPIEYAPYDNVRQQCCYRCAGQTCGGSGGCKNKDSGDCPKKCDKCRCNHSFVSCGSQ